MADDLELHAPKDGLKASFRPMSAVVPELPDRINKDKLVLWEDNPRFEYDHEKEEKAFGVVDPRDAIFLAHYMATGDVIKAAEEVGYPPTLAAKLLKTPDAIHWMRRMQRKRLDALMVDADDLVSRINTMSLDAEARFKADPKDTKSRAFAMECLMNIAILRGLTSSRKGDSAPQNITNNVIFGPDAASLLAANSNLKSAVKPVHRPDDLSGGVQPVVHRGVEQGEPRESPDIHEPA